MYTLCMFVYISHVSSIIVQTNVYIVKALGIYVVTA